ncbi:NTF2-like protein [Trichodelitschia bisporula]|uniref:NTF2-like protein n=1 Tax=Trichodelitschia bisporula TaxID=703511 RepID=A0A6G1IBA8_9PEZI|nr:NTF2-like protein [Trichodelitschia bisporula]
MAVQTLTTGDNFFTSFNTSVPRLFITAETDTEEEFDQVTLEQWRAEGFRVTYLPYGKGSRGYVQDLESIGRNLSLGDSFAVVAFGDAAATCLETFRKSTRKLCALVAYYPTSIPDPHSSFPIGMKTLVHLAGEEVGVTRAHEVLGIQGKRRTTTKKIPSGTGTGGKLKLAYPSYTYTGVAPGFAEHDLEEYDKVADRLAWSRSLDCLRKAFKTEVDLESVWEEHVELEFMTRDADRTMATMVNHPYVNHVPVLTGGIGKKALHRFYQDFFIPSNPPSLKMKLLSRTIGVDRVVDEMFTSFTHSQEMPWILPGIPPTNKHVEVALVSVVCIRGGKLYHEHIYWDQASVLVQIGLLDPNVVPQAMKNKGVERLPVVGKESARKVLDEDSVPSNELVTDW